MRDRLILHFDGGCRPNPGPMEAAVVMRGETRVRTDLGHGDNNQAEWLALLYAAEIAVEAGADDVLFVGDSALVVGQALGRRRCRSARLRTCLARFETLAASIDRIHLKQVPRSKNLAGIALARRRR